MSEDLGGNTYDVSTPTFPELPEMARNDSGQMAPIQCREMAQADNADPEMNGKGSEQLPPTTTMPERPVR